MPNTFVLHERLKAVSVSMQQVRSKTGIDLSISVCISSKVLFDSICTFAQVLNYRPSCILSDRHMYVICLLPAWWVRE